MYPEASQEVAERPGIRRTPLVRYPYVIYYKLAAGEVTILRVRHTARRLLEDAER